ncbi:MAG: hypothetical protein HWE30_10350 [Methylocystaceae bacterium]|nr:hypothetical protein [Methylocystaceae bacterium]
MVEQRQNAPCKNTFDMTVRIVIEAVRERMVKGELDAMSLQEIESALTVENGTVEAFCHSVHERCMSKYQLDLAVPPRTNAFGRVMVQPFENLLDRRHCKMSTKQLPNYFNVLSTVLGRERYESLHDQVSQLMRQEIRDHGGGFSWGTFYQHPEVVKIRLETLYSIAHAFSHFDARLEWFINVMEGSGNGDTRSKGALQFTHTQARDCLLALFGEFIRHKSDEKSYQQAVLSEPQRKEIAHLIAKLKQM